MRATICILRKLTEDLDLEIGIAIQDNSDAPDDILPLEDHRCPLTTWKIKTQSKPKPEISKQIMVQAIFAKSEQDGRLSTSRNINFAVIFGPRYIRFLRCSTRTCAT